ncbi:uncharacterized protein LOC108949429 [Ciona intestinalis]
MLDLFEDHSHKINQKVKNLTLRLAQRFTEQQHIELSADEYFNEVVSALPQSKIKAYLLKNFEQEFQLFKGYCETCKHVIISSNDPDVQTQLSLAEELLLYQDNPEKLRVSLNSQLQQKSCNSFSQLLLVVLGLDSKLVLNSVADGIYRFCETTLTNTLASEPCVRELKQLKDFILKICFLLQIRHGEFEKQEIHSDSGFDAIMSALFSLYIDVEINLNIKCNEEAENIGNVIVEKAHLILGTSPQLPMSALLQVSSRDVKNCSVVLLPLYLNILLENPWPRTDVTITQYLQYILATKQAMSMTNQTSLLQGKVLKFAAPLSFYDWLVKRQGGSKLLDSTTIVQTTESYAVTKYLVQDADLKLVEDFLDLCLDGVHLNAEDKAVNAVIPMEQEEQTKNVKEEDAMFYVDKNPSCGVLNVEQLDKDYIKDVKEKCMLLLNKGEEPTSAVEKTDDEESCENIPSTPKNPKRKSYLSKSARSSKRRKRIVDVKPLTPILEGKQKETLCKITNPLKVELSTRKLRSESECSTGSHGYSTRSQKNMS